MATPTERSPILDLIGARADADYLDLLTRNIPVPTAPLRNSVSRAPFGAAPGPVTLDSETFDPGRGDYTMHFTYRHGGTVTGRIRGDIPLLSQVPRRRAGRDVETVSLAMDLADLERRAMARMVRSVDDSLLQSFVAAQPPPVASPTPADAIAMMAQAMARVGITPGQLRQMSSPGALDAVVLQAALQREQPAGVGVEPPAPEPLPVNPPRPTRGRRRLVR